MKLKIIDIVTPEYGEEAFDNFQKQNPGIKIATKHVCPHQKPERLKSHDEFTGYDRLYIFYETKDDVQYSSDRDMINENAQIEMCKDIADAIYLNREEFVKYMKLKNSDQRRIFMLENHNVPAKDADKVHELLVMYHTGAIRAPKEE